MSAKVHVVLSNHVINEHYETISIRLVQTYSSLRMMHMTLSDKDKY